MDIDLFRMNALGLNELANDMESFVREREQAEITEPETASETVPFERLREYINELRVIVIQMALQFQEEDQP